MNEAKKDVVTYMDDIKNENPGMSSDKVAIQARLAKAELKTEIANTEKEVAEAYDRWHNKRTKLGSSYSGIAEYEEKCKIELAEKKLKFLNALLEERFPS